MLIIRNQSGFTLIEILISAIILFSSIAIVTVIYKGAYTSTLKAEAHVSMAGVVPIIVNNIQQKIRENANDDNLTKLSGKDISWNVHYSWHAELIEFKAPPKIFDPESGKLITSHKKYKLWQIKLFLTDKVAKKEYQYKELSWNEK